MSTICVLTWPYSADMNQFCDAVSGTDSKSVLDLLVLTHFIDTVRVRVNIRMYWCMYVNKVSPSDCFRQSTIASLRVRRFFLDYSRTCVCLQLIGSCENFRVVFIDRASERPRWCNFLISEEYIWDNPENLTIFAHIVIPARYLHQRYGGRKVCRVSII